MRDYQPLKRKLLVEAGLPRRALRMTVVIDERGDGHAVLMVRTDRGDFILDNKHQSVLPWHQTGYVYIKREGQDGRAWTSLGGAVSPTTTAKPMLRSFVRKTGLSELRHPVTSHPSRPDRARRRGQRQAGPASLRGPRR